MSKASSETPWLTGPTLAARVSCLTAAYTVSRWLTRPTPGRPTRTPSDLGLCWEPLECRTRDAVRLVGWVAAPPAPRGTVALFHGVRHNRTQTLERFAFLVAAGFRCVAFDHRAHGESGGQRTSFGYRESQDVLAVMDLIRRCWPAQPRAILGIAMGGAAICYAAAGLRGVAAVILESVHHDVGPALESCLSNSWAPGARQLAQGVIWVTERRLGFRLDQLAPVNHIDGLAPTPVLFLTGANDPHATPTDVRRLHDHYPGQRELALVPQAAHQNVCAAGGSCYGERVVEFLRRWM